MNILVMGPSRTGTTMLGRLLSETGQVHLVPELHFFDEVFKGSSTSPLAVEKLERSLPKLLMRARTSYYKPDAMTDAVISEARELASLWQGLNPAQVYLKFLEYEKRRSGKALICDQTPRNIEFIDHILREDAYLTCRVILTMRDPISVVTSQKFRHRRRGLGGSNIGRFNTVRTKLGYNVISMTLAWVRSAQLAQKYCSEPATYLFRYEDFLFDQHEATHDVLGFCCVSGYDPNVSVPYAGSSLVADGTLSSRGKNNERQLTRSERVVVASLSAGQASQFSYELARPTAIQKAMAFPLHTFRFLLSVAVRADILLLYLRKLLTR